MAQIKLTNPLHNALITVLNYTMVVAFAATLAYWVWVFLKPSPIADIPPSAPVAQTIVPTILAAHWFSSNNSAPIQAILQNTNMKLVGVFSSTSKRPGFAIFQLEGGKQQHAVVNHEIVPGVQLVAVKHNSVTIEQNGVRSDIEFINAANTQNTIQAMSNNNNAPATPAPQINTPAPAAAPAPNEPEKPFNIQELIKQRQIGK